MSTYLSVQQSFYGVESAGISPVPENDRSASRYLHFVDRSGDRKHLCIFPPGANDEPNSLRWDRANVDSALDVEEPEDSEEVATIFGVKSLSREVKRRERHKWVEYTIETPSDGWDAFTLVLHR